MRVSLGSGLTACLRARPSAFGPFAKPTNEIPKVAFADSLRLASRRACENLVQLVLDQNADALLLAGDVYDGDWQDFQTGAFFVRQMTRLDDAGVPVFMIAGNHDAASEITRSLRLPRNVQVLSTTAPETVLREDLGLAVHGQGFATRAVTVLADLAADWQILLLTHHDHLAGLPVRPDTPSVTVIALDLAGPLEKVRDADTIRAEPVPWPAQRTLSTRPIDDGPDPSDVRAWARANGHDVGERGRISAEVRSAYLLHRV